jgi:hypothetical protein
LLLLLLLLLPLVVRTELTVLLLPLVVRTKLTVSPFMLQGLVVLPDAGLPDAVPVDMVPLLKLQVCAKSPFPAIIPAADRLALAACLQHAKLVTRRALGCCCNASQQKFAG